MIVSEIDDSEDFVEYVDFRKKKNAKRGEFSALASRRISTIEMSSG